MMIIKIIKTDTKKKKKTGWIINAEKLVKLRSCGIAGKTLTACDCGKRKEWPWRRKRFLRDGTNCQTINKNMDGPKILEEEVNYVAGRIENKMAVGSNKIIIEDIKI